MSTSELNDAAVLDQPPARPAAAGAAAPAAEAPWFRPRLAWYAIGMVAAVTMFGQLDRGIMSLLVGSIERDTHMTDTELSLLMGLAYSVVYMFGGLPISRLTDSKRRTFILPGALAVWSLGTALCGVAQNFWQFFVFRGLIGGGESVKGPASVSLIPDIVPREKLARAFGVYNIAIMGGEALSLIVGGLLLGWLSRHSPVRLPVIGEVHGWQMVYLIFGIPGMMLALLFALTVPEPARHGRTRVGSAPVKEVAAFLFKGPASKVIVPLFLAAVINGIYLMGVGAWRPVFYERTYGVPAHQYGPIVGLIGLITTPVGVAIGAFVVERMIKRWDDSHMRLVLIVNLCTAPIAVLSPLMPTFQLALACQIVAGTLMMVAAPSQLAAMQLITPNEMRGQVNAFYMFTVGVLGQGVGPTIVALLTDYVFRQESQIRFAMVTAGAIATPLVLLCYWRAVRPFGVLYRQTVDQETA